MTCPDGLALVVDHAVKQVHSIHSSQEIFCLRQSDTLASDIFTNEEASFNPSLAKLKYEVGTIVNTCELFNTGNIHYIINKFLKNVLKIATT